MSLTKKQIQHFYWRAGFGIHGSELDQLKTNTAKQIVDRLFAESEVIKPMDVDVSKLKVSRKGKTQLEIKALNVLSAEKMEELNVKWMKRMTQTKGVLREKMTFFFHDHFAVRISDARHNLELHEIMRRNALGSFEKMLTEVSKSPAMLIFLNSRQNVKTSPNENFAREVMELFTLGRDNGYTEKDIQEAARAFTGWSTDVDGEFIFIDKNHDNGEKTFMGEKGNFDGDDILKIILKQKGTARYLCEKIVDFLISRPITPEKMEVWSNQFYTSGYNLQVLISNILLSPEFIDNQTIGCRIKSPTEFLVGISKLFNIDFQAPRTLVHLQSKLNQRLFFPPDVSGWTSGKGWIDSTTIILRMKIPSMLLNFGVIEVDDEDISPEEMNMRLLNQRTKIQENTERKLKAYPDWDFFEKEVQTETDRLVEFILQPEALPSAMQIMKQAEEVPFKQRVIELLSLPDYQLC